jgi:hypothetical protein
MIAPAVFIADFQSGLVDRATRTSARSEDLQIVCGADHLDDAGHESIVRDYIPKMAFQQTVRA